MMSDETSDSINDTYFLFGCQSMKLNDSIPIGKQEWETLLSSIQNNVLAPQRRYYATRYKKFAH